MCNHLGIHDVSVAREGSSLSKVVDKGVKMAKKGKKNLGYEVDPSEEFDEEAGTSLQGEEPKLAEKWHAKILPHPYYFRLDTTDHWDQVEKIQAQILDHVDAMNEFELPAMFTGIQRKALEVQRAEFNM